MASICSTYLPSSQPLPSYLMLLETINPLVSCLGFDYIFLKFVIYMNYDYILFVYVVLSSPGTAERVPSFDIVRYNVAPGQATFPFEATSSGTS